MATRSDKNSKHDNVVQTKRHNNPFVYFGTIGILIITIIAFVLVPSLGGGLGDDQGLTFGSWAGKPISFAQGSYLASQVQLTKTRLEQQGYRDTGDQFFAYQVWRQAFENTVVHMALLDHANTNSIAVSEDFLDRQMARHPAFIEDGTFSRRLFREASNAYKMSIRQEIRETALKQLYVNDMVSVPTSSAETAFIKAMAQAERSIEFVTFPFANYPDSERKAFAMDNAALFRQHKLSRITLTSSQKEAQQILDRIKAGTLSFEEAARNHSKDAAATRGGDVGWQFNWEIRNDLKDPGQIDGLATLSEGSLSAVLDSVAGSWLIFRADAAVLEADPDSTEVLANVTTYMNRYERVRIEDWALDTARHFAAVASSDFHGAAIIQGLAIKESNAFPLNYGGAFDLGYFALLGSIDTQSNPELSGANTNESFLRAIFTLEAGQISGPLIMNETVIIATLKEIQAADDSTLGLIEAYYPSIVQDIQSRELADSILKSPKLKDEFFTAFSKAFATAF
jgi:hypothetical protein